MAPVMESDGELAIRLCSEGLPDNILPPEVVLCKPTPEEIKHGATRMIFLNTPLDEMEQRQLRRLLNELKMQGRTCPTSMHVHLLRLLQHAKGDPTKAIHQMDKNILARSRWMPLVESDIAADLQAGAIYWSGGRDRRCRPCLVVAADKISQEFAENPDRICRVAIFLLEYMIRYGLCPGRVENWGVIVDLSNAGAHAVPPVRLILDLVDSMQGMYRFRMAWTRIINAPWWFSSLWTMIKHALPGESVRKVQILDSHYAAELQALFLPPQLESRFGGTAPDRRTPGAFLPFRFTPGPFDDALPPLAAPAAPAAPALVAAAAAQREVAAALAGGALHKMTTTDMHIGTLWIKGDEERWLSTAVACPLMPSAAEYLRREFDVVAKPCATLPDLLQLLTPAVTRVAQAAEDEAAVAPLDAACSLQSGCLVHPSTSAKAALPLVRPATLKRSTASLPRVESAEASCHSLSLSPCDRAAQEELPTFFAWRRMNSMGNGDKKTQPQGWRSLLQRRGRSDSREQDRAGGSLMRKLRRFRGK